MQFATLFIAVFAAVAFAAPQQEARAAQVRAEQLLDYAVWPDL
jgi:hypothetical protein